MRRISLCSGGIAALIVAAHPAPAHQPTGQRAAPTALPASARGAAVTVDAFHAALRRGDTKAAAALLSDDAIIFEEGGAEHTKTEYAAEHLPADAAFSQVIGSSVTRRAGGSNGVLAWIASEGRVTGTYKGKPVDRVTTETVLLRRIGSVWAIIHIHWSSAGKQ